LHPVALHHAGGNFSLGIVTLSLSKVYGWPMMIWKRMRQVSFVVGLSMISLQAHALEEKDLVGTWRLQSCVLLKKDGDQPWCKNPFGVLNYTSSGFMAMAFNCMKPEHDKEITTDPKDMVFYMGKFSIKDNGKILHHVENSSEISRIGKALEREVKIKGDEITLTGMGVRGPVRTVWKREK
jgi:hypothetical protein